VTSDNPGLTLVVLAAGRGSRFGGLKQFEPLGPDGNVLFEYSAYDAIAAGFSKIVLVVQNTFVDELSTVVSDLSDRVAVEYAFQDQYRPEGEKWPVRKKPWGTAHALLAARHLVKEPFVLCNADDYYGASAFAKAAEFLTSQAPDSTHYGMLGYSLHSTLSGNGSVSRGVCEITNRDRLTSLVEHTKIILRDDAFISEDAKGIETPLDESQIVSMNFWLMTPSIWSFLDTEVEKFANRYLQDVAAEFRLPDVIGTFIKQGDVTVDCLPHNEHWFGLTHSEDRERAVAEINSMHDDGIYPTPLWREVDSNL
jgi:dTDP-glucose pyrophosphorylase